MEEGNFDTFKDVVAHYIRGSFRLLAALHPPGVWRERLGAGPPLRPWMEAPHADIVPVEREWRGSGRSVDASLFSAARTWNAEVPCRLGSGSLFVAGVVRRSLALITHIIT